MTDFLDAVGLCLVNRRGGLVSSFSGRSGRRNLNLDSASIDVLDEDADSQAGDFNDTQTSSVG